MDDQFQITLPSNSSVNYYPKNKGNSYTTHLHSKINLEGQWEVALMDIQYPFTGQNIQKDIVIGVIVHKALKRQPEEDDFDKYCYDHGLLGNSMTDEEAAVSYQGKTDQEKATLKLTRGDKTHSMLVPFGYYRATIPAGYYRLIGNLLAKLTAKISEAFAFMELKDAPVTARYLPDKDRVKITTTPNKVVELVSNSSYLPSLLGCPINKPTPEGYTFVVLEESKGDKSFISELPPTLDPLTTMYIYTDIVKSQIVGDTQCPLIGVVPIKQEERDVCFFSFSHPYYVTLTSQEISEINIQLKTDTGDPFPLASNGKVVCRLHFRRKHRL